MVSFAAQVVEKRTPAGKILYEAAPVPEALRAGSDDDSSAEDSDAEGKVGLERLAAFGVGKGVWMCGCGWGGWVDEGRATGKVFTEFWTGLLC